MTATSSSNALGVFDATAYDDTLAGSPGTGTVVGTAAVTVALPPTTMTTSTTTTTTEPTSATTTATPPSTVAATSGKQFARTGSDAVAYALVALGMVAVGGGILLAARRATEGSATTSLASGADVLDRGCGTEDRAGRGPVNVARVRSPDVEASMVRGSEDQWR